MVARRKMALAFHLTLLRRGPSWLRPSLGCLPCITPAGIPEALESLSAERRYGPGIITMEEPRRGQPRGERSGHCVERRPHIRVTRPQSRLPRAGRHSIAPASRRARSVPGQIAACADNAMASEVPFLTCAGTHDDISLLSGTLFVQGGATGPKR